MTSPENTRTDPVNLDLQIRARLDTVRRHMTDHMDAPDYDSVDPLFNDAGELGRAVTAVLDLHEPQLISPSNPAEGLFCERCVGKGLEPFSDYPCPTVTAIASSLRLNTTQETT